MEANNLNKKERALKKIKQIKGFYNHLFIYVFMNIVIMAINITSQVNNGWSFYDALFFFGNLITPLSWGIGLFFHGAKVFGFSPFFSKDWEERKIKKFLEDDRNEYEKYK